MTKFIYKETVILKKTGKEYIIESVTFDNSKPAKYKLSNGKIVFDEDINKLSKKKPKKAKRTPKKKTIISEDQNN